MTRKKQKRGQNDVNAILLKGSRDQCADRIEILHADYKMPEYRWAFGCYELDNNQKKSFVTTHIMGVIMLNIHILVGKSLTMMI